MDDLPLTLVFSAALVFLIVVLTSGIAVAHTDVRLPKALRYGSDDRKFSRRALLVEVPLCVVLVGGGTLILVLFVIHPNSIISVRLVAAAALVASAAWFVYLGAKILGRR